MADVELRVTADLDQATKELAGFSKEYAQLVKQVEKPLRQVNATRELEANLEATGKQVRQARQRLQELQRELVNTDYPTTQLKESFREATKELQKLERVEATQVSQLSRMRSELKGAGVDTTRLAQEQRRLNSELTSAMGAGRQDAAARGIRERAAALKQQAVAQRQANLEAARESLGVNRYRALQSEIQGVTRQYDLLRRNGNLTSRELAVAQRAMTTRIRETQQAMRDLAVDQRRSTGSAGIVGGVGAVTAGYAAASGIAAVARIADSYAMMNARLKLATDSQEEFNRAQQELSRIADSVGAPFENLVGLYSRLSKPLKEAGRGQGETIKVVEAVTLAFRVSGASAEEAQEGVRQFGQALNGVALQGEEYNTFVDSAPKLLEAFAAELGVTTGELKKLVEEGKVTRDVMINGMLNVLPQLEGEFAAFGGIIGAEVTKIQDALKKGIGQVDTGPLVDSLRELKETLQDESVQKNLATLAAALVKLAEAGATGASEFVDLGERIGYWSAAVSGNVTELDKLDQQINDVKRSLDGWTLNDIIYSDEELQAELKSLEAERERVLAELEGTNQKRVELAEAVADELENVRQRDLDSQKKAADDGKAIQEQQIKDTEAALKKQVAAERKAASELGSAKKAQLETQQRYQEALAKVNGGVAGDPSYASATALKVSARNALQAGDVEGAKRQAQAALAVIEQLAAAGENTFGFGGFIKELQAIEQAADQKGIDSAQQKLEEAKKAAAATKAALEELKDVKVSATLSPEDEQKLLDQLQTLAEKAGIILTIPVTPVMPEPGELDSEGYAYVPNNPPPPQFATGGYTGPGGVYEPAGVVHRGEVVWSQLDIARAGGVAVVEAMRRGMRGYSMGGIVAAPRLMPSIPAISPSLLQQSSPGRDLGRVDLNVGGETYSLLADGDQFDRLLKRTSRKFGRTAR